MLFQPNLIMKLIHSAASKCWKLALSVCSKHLVIIVFVMAPNESRPWTLMFSLSGANPTIMICNSSIVKFYNTRRCKLNPTIFLCCNYNTGVVKFFNSSLHQVLCCKLVICVVKVSYWYHCSIPMNFFYQDRNDW